MQTKYVYMIRRKSDGLYSTGGMHPKFTQKGKVWNTKGGLSNHIAQFTTSYEYVDKSCYMPFDNYEIVNIKVTADVDTTSPLSTLFDAALDRERKRQEEAAKRRQEYKKERAVKLQAELDQLKKDLLA